LRADHGKYHMHIVPIASVRSYRGSRERSSHEIGERYGTKLFKPGARFFKPEYECARTSSSRPAGSRRGDSRRFIPIIRTIDRSFVGISEMRRRTFSCST